MNVWLDDERAPHMYGHLGWTWVKSYEEAVAILKTGKVEKISLDHDLLPQHYQIPGKVPEWANDERTGYHVALWMEENGIWPAEVAIHSMSEAGRARIAAVCRRCRVKCYFEIAQRDYGAMSTSLAGPCLACGSLRSCRNTLSGRVICTSCGWSAEAARK